MPRGGNWVVKECYSVYDVESAINATGDDMEVHQILHRPVGRDAEFVVILRPAPVEQIALAPDRPTLQYVPGSGDGDEELSGG